ncbi:MAG: PAS domain S-box protein [Bacteroidetes bacterium]|nr:PAS domain S-box protein [Bacteroidota bacterium]
MPNTETLQHRINELESELQRLKSGHASNDLHEDVIFRNAIERSIQSGISVSDADGKKIYVNQTFCNLIGYEASEVLHKYPPYDHWPKMELDKISESFYQSLDNLSPKEGIELVFQHKSGRLFPVQVVVSSFELNSKTYFVSNITDITHRKQAEFLKQKNEEILSENEKIRQLNIELKQASESLIQGKAAYRVLVENSPEALVVIDMESQKFVSYSLSALQLLKLSAEKITEIGLNEICPLHQPNGEKSIDAAKKHLDYALKGGKPKFEWVHIDSEGKEILCEVQLVKIPSEKGVLVRGSITDIREKKKEEALRKDSEDRLRQIFKTLLEGVALNEIIYNEAGEMIDYRIIEVNEAFYQLADYNKEVKVIGSKASELYGVEPEKIKAYLLKQRDVKSTTHFEAFRENSNKYFIVSSSPIQNNRFVTTFHDITQYKLIEKSLIEGKNFLNETQLIANLGTYVLDLNTGQWDSSEILDKIFGIPSNYEKNIENWVAILHPDWKDTMNTYFTQEVIAKRGQFNKEYKIIRQNDGAERWVYGVGHLKFNERGELTSMVGTIRDITERKLMEIELINAKELAEKNEKDLLIKNKEYEQINEKLKQINAELMEASRDIKERKITEAELVKKSQELAAVNKELEQFVYVASHDLQEPLRTISNFVGLLNKQETNRSEDENNYLKFISKASSKMQHLIKDLLDFSRIGKKIRIETLDCNLLIKEVIDELSASIQESHAKISISPMPIIKANEIELKNLFQNLISNAIKFQKKNDQPSIVVNCIENENDYLFSVKDNGIGIDKQFNNRIFIIFQRLHNDSEYLGTGIGLATCKKIVLQHNGKIWVESKLGEGSTFFFTISKNII